MPMNKNEANKRLIEKINVLERDNDKNFSNTQKILLTTDGSITAILDVLYGKIDLSTLEQHTEIANEENAKLIDSEAGDEINFREIIMHKDGKPLIYAVSYIPLDRLTEEIKCDLISADIPIGRILKNYRIESRREIKNIFIEKPNETLKELYGTDEEFLSRDYVIIHKGEILMWIKESFPISYFTEI
ncbi:MAG: chorismate lyase [Methanobrevibacter sp.]|uniref:chorismate--pyruvate lyase family protein n=1 Tax=Methanobrevibacter sp. TaxID=66852 RepID=UPI0026E01E55|nr:chorismate lyase [Methanobrevibacter sp.]MDO5848552.1 chorismate lyase [Methanobrevibacter sp.]